MSESDLSKTTCAIIKTIGGHVSTVEAAESAAGIPDLDFCVDGIEGHIELKFGTAKKGPKLRPTQYRWFRKRIKAGGKPFFLLLNGDTNVVSLVGGAHYNSLTGYTTTWHWESLATRQWAIGDEFKQGLDKYIKTGK